MKGPDRRNPVSIAAGQLGAARRWAGDVEAAEQVLNAAKLERYIAELGFNLTPAQRAHLVSKLSAPDVDLVSA